MHSTRLLPTLALLLTTLVACDSEPVESLDAELDAAAEHELLLDLQQQLEREHGLELQIATSPDEPDTLILRSEVTDITPGPAAGVCGGGRWEFKPVKYGCGSCDVLGVEGEKVEHYRRWCLEGGPSCGCDPWFYHGWSCFTHVCS